MSATTQRNWDAGECFDGRPTRGGHYQEGSRAVLSFGFPMTEDELEILEEFIQESREHLAAIEPDLLEMERQGSATASEIVNRVFRAIHSTKGGAAFLAFESLKEFSHVMESVLMLIRDGELSITPKVIDALLSGVDVLRRMLDDLRASDSVDCTAERRVLNAILEEPESASDQIATESQNVESTRAGEPCEAGAAPNVAHLPEPSGVSNQSRHAVITEALAHGQLLYRVVVSVNADLAALGLTEQRIEERISSVGRLIQRFPASMAQTDGDQAASTAEWEVATVLDRRLLAAATGLPEHCILPASRHAAMDERDHATGLGREPTAPAARVATLAVTPSIQEQPVPTRAKLAGPTELTSAQVPSSDPLSSRKEKANAPFAAKDPVSEGPETLRVRVELLNHLMDSASELVLGRNQLLRALKEQSDKSAGLGIILQHIDRVTTDLQEGIMQTRMQQIGQLFGRFARVARDLGRQLGKNVELRAEGNHVELDKSIIEALADPLTHIVRNAVDHGLETPEERRKKKKPEVGRILLSASHESGQVKIVVEDDGRGIDRGKVLRKAIEKDIITASAADKASDRDVVNLLMAAGFSTADQVSDVSGRGVGMDVVRNNVEALGGQIEIDTAPGLGTSVQLRLPLTLAIIPSLIVGAAGARFAVPQASIVELVWVRSDDVQERIQQLQGALMLRLRERLVPLVKVADVLNTASVDGTDENAAVGAAVGKDHYILLLRTGTDHYGLMVDELFESEEIVVKPLPLFLKGIDCFAGTTILGDGSVTMILDPSGIAARAGLRFASANETEVGSGVGGRQSAVAKRSVILFAGGPEEQYIVPQEQVLRLERVDRSKLQRTGGRDYICYRGAGLPLVRLERFLPVGGVPDLAEEVFLLIPRMVRGRDAEPTAGILVWRILDALDLDLNVQPALFQGPGVKGATLLDGVLTTFLDPVALVEHAHSSKEHAA